VKYLKFLPRLTCLVALLFVGFSSEAEPYEIKFGAVLPLSGPAANAGEDIRRGFELAKEDFSSPHFNVSLLFEDSRMETKSAVSAAQKLLTTDRVDAIFSLWDTADPIAPLAEARKTPHLAIRWNDNLARQFDFTFTFESTYKTFSSEFARLIRDQKFKTVSFLLADAQGWLLAADAFRAAAKENNLQIISEQIYPSDGIDYRALALKALQGHPDIVLIYDISDNLLQLAKSIKQYNKEQRVTGYLAYPVDLSLFEGEYFIDQLGLSSEFADKYQSRFHERVYARAQLAYDIFAVMFQALGKFNIKPNGVDLAKAISNVHEFKGASGIIKKSHPRVFETQCSRKMVKQAMITNSSSF
jgi:ABC-type branched-subunit amino acid transport system substrate-binding protein